MERIVNEFRVIETDDGFRIEIKGDKEKIRSLLRGFGRHGDKAHWRAHHRHGPWEGFGLHFGPWMWMKAASCWGMGDAEEEESEETQETEHA